MNTNWQQEIKLKLKELGLPELSALIGNNYFVFLKIKNIWLKTRSLK